jgi:hypothetical protein
MKKLLLILAVVALVSCEKETIAPSTGGRILPEWYFSRVRYYQAPRTGQTDTTWTLKMTTDSMRIEFKKYDGYVYEQTPQFIEIGKLWEKQR